MKEKTVLLAAHVPKSTLTDAPKECNNPDLLSINLNTLSEKELRQLMFKIREELKRCKSAHRYAMLKQRYELICSMLNIENSSLDGLHNCFDLKTQSGLIVDVADKSERHFRAVISKRKR